MYRSYTVAAMVLKIAEYKLREGELPEVLKAIESFVHEVSANEPETVYQAFRKGDSGELLHLMRFTDAEAEERHRCAAYTRDFVAVLYPRCEQPPRFTELTEIE